MFRLIRLAVEQKPVKAAASMAAPDPVDLRGPYWLFGSDGCPQYPVTVCDGGGLVLAQATSVEAGNLLIDLLNAATRQPSTVEQEVERVTKALRERTHFLSDTGGCHAVAQLGRDAITLIHRLCARVREAERANG